MNDWPLVTVADLGTVVTGATPKASEPDSWGDSLAFITPSDQGVGARRARPARRLSPTGAARLGRRTIPANSTCFTCIGSVGKVSLTDGEAVTNQQINSVVPNRFNDGRFIYYLLRHRAADIARISSGSATPIINKAHFSAFGLQVPDLPTQRAVADVLGALDDKIEVNERIRRITLSLARSHYDAAATGSVTERISDLAALYDGPHATPRKTDSGPWFLSISSLQNGYLDLTESAHLAEEDFPRWTRRVQPQAGDVLFSYETRLGDAALMPPGIRGSLGRRMALLRGKSASVSGALLLHAYLSEAFQDEIRRRTIHGATVDRLPLKEMPGWRIPLPAEGSRERLSAELDALHARVTQTAREDRTLAALRDTLLPRLMSGELRVRDAERIAEDAV